MIQAAGIKPATEWLKGTVNLDKRGFINTDPYLRTNLPDVYAIGDATLVYPIPAQQRCRLPWQPLRDVKPVTLPKTFLQKIQHGLQGRRWFQCVERFRLPFCS